MEQLSRKRKEQIVVKKGEKNMKGSPWHFIHITYQMKQIRSTLIVLFHLHEDLC